MASFSICDALTTLCQSIPDWYDRLDEQIIQISIRQIELARLSEAERPPTRSVRNKGSTESLRPHDEDNDPFESLTSKPTSPQPSSAAADARGPAIKASPTLKIADALVRESSSPVQAKANGVPAKKRKPASLASGESVAPKYRTRSMFIVYYDGAVQRAFENLVAFVSARRAALRKGKMEAKRIAMNRAAELELDEDDENGADLGDLTASKGGVLAPHIDASLDRKAPVVPGIGDIAAAEFDNTNETEPIVPLLSFISTRQIGPTRGAPQVNHSRGTLSTTMLGGYRRSGGVAPDVFEIIDKGLEWVQAHCEHAASHVLRNPDCNTEIADIKSRLAEVKSTAEAEIERLTASQWSRPESSASGPRGKQLKAVMERREFNGPTELDVDGIEVDDEGVDDSEPPKFIFKRSREVGHQ